MTTSHESVALLSRALDQTGDLLAAIHEDQLSLPTPCAEWDVAHLVAHVVQDPRTFLAMAQGHETDWSAAPPALSAGWTTTFRSVADDLIHHWHQAGDAAEPGQVDWQTAEFAVHAWDLARAIGYGHPLDPEVAERGLSFMSTSLSDENRGGAFGPEQSAPEGAAVQERLAAFSGRSV